VLPCKSGEEFIRACSSLWDIKCRRTTMYWMNAFPNGARALTTPWSLKAQTRLQDLLTHLYVLVPVLDAEKHYWVGDDELEKLLRHGEGWLRPASRERK